MSEKVRSVSIKTIDFARAVSSDIANSKISKCQAAMRVYWKSQEQECQSVGQQNSCTTKPPKKLLTGSKYDGSWEGHWMTGYGGYVFTNGVEYEGDMKDGMFHGQGDLWYPNGIKVRATWIRGKAFNRTIIFPNNLIYVEDGWNYLKDPDRRYKAEYDEGVQPAGNSYITAEKPSRDIPDGLYDTGDGFLDPKTYIYICDEIGHIVRTVSEKEKRWIMKNCRQGGKVPGMARPELYKEWLRAQLKLSPPPPPAAPICSETSLLRCSSVFDDDVDFMVRFLNMGGSSSSGSSSDF